jgi:hypothetical protein
LKECPYQFGRVESSCGILRAHHDMLRPDVSHPTDKIMHDRHMITTAHPFFPNDIGLMKEVRCFGEQVLLILIATG